MNILEIVIHRQAPDGWPVVAKFNQTGDFLPRRWEGTLKLDESDLLPLQLNPLAYGIYLGERLFCDSIRDALREARTSSPDRLRVQLIVEAPELRHWRWETLCGPIGVGGKWQHLTLDQRSLYSLYLPSLTDRRFPAIGRQDLRALIVVASPPEGNRYKLGAFSEADAIAGATQSLGSIPHEVLATTAEATGQPTIDEICWRLTSQHYTILHIVAHGLFRTDDGETILYLLDDKGDVRPITATAFIDRLQNLQGVKGLPHLVFLASCDSAAPEAERVGAMGGLGQRLVRELGVPAVIAMTQRVSVETANELASKFYEQLNDNGDVVGALVDATAYLAEAGDITVPAIYERLGGRLLFDSAVTRELTNVEIIAGLKRLQALLADQPERPGRAPILTAELSRYAAQWRRLLLPDAITTPRQQLSPQAQAEWLEAESNINALCEQVLDLSFRALALGQEPAPYDARCPFPGLAAFRDEFKAFFFGRENLVAKLVRRWQENNFLAILGPSGSGKSSLVLAGIAPQMERENPNLRLVYMTPTANPLHQLAATQLPEARSRSRILLLVDQFEELFTLCTEEETRRQFLDELLTLTEEMRVVITMRADFWGDCAPYPALRQLMLQQQELIAPMTLPELRSAMEQQADAVGLRFEDDLVHTILSEVEGEPGAMPLLQHLLKGLWERRRGRWLLTREYRALGGIRQAIAVTAQTVYDNLSRDEQAFMKHIFVRLTHLDESGGMGQRRRNTRRRVALQDLAAGGKTVSDVRAFVYKPELRGLLITSQRDDPLQGNDKTNSDDQTDDGGRLVEVEVIHEAVIRHWGQLQEWLDQDYEMLRQRQRVQQEAADWRQAADLSLREGLLLLHGARLLRVKEWRDKGELALNENEKAYVVACDQKEQAQQQREREQLRQLAEEQRQRAEEAEQAAARQKRLTHIAVAIGGLTIILAIVAILFWRSSQLSEEIAVASAENARQQGWNAQVKALGLAAQSLENDDPEVRLLLETTVLQAALAADLEPDTKPLFRALAAPYITTLSGEFLGFSSSGQRMVTTDQFTTWIWNTLTGELVTNVTGSSLLSPNGTRLFNMPNGEGPYLIDAATGAFVGTFPNERLLAFSPNDSRLLTADSRGVIRVRDNATGQEIIQLAGQFTDIGDAIGMDFSFYADGVEAETVVFNNDGSRFVLKTDGLSQLWSSETGDIIASGVTALFSPDGTLLLTCDYRVIDAQTGSEVSLLAVSEYEKGSREDNPAYYENFIFSHDNTRIALAKADEVVAVWDTATGQLIVDQYFWVDGMATWGSPNAVYSPNSLSMITGLGSNFTHLRDMATGEILDNLNSGSGMRTHQAYYSPDNSKLLINNFDDSRPLLFDISTPSDASEEATIEPRVIGTLTGHRGRVHSAMFSPSGLLILTSSYDGTARLWDVETGFPVAVLSGHEDGVQWATFSPNGARLVTVDIAGTSRLWNMSWFEPMVTNIRGRLPTITHDGDGISVITVCYQDWSGGELRFETWDIEQKMTVTTGEGCPYEISYFSPFFPERTIYELSEGEIAYALSADGKIVFSTLSSSNSTRLRYADTNEIVAELSGHSLPIGAGSFSPDQLLLVTGAPVPPIRLMGNSGDTTTRFWETSTWESVLTLEPMMLSEVAFTVDGRGILAIASKSDDGFPVAIYLIDMVPSLEVDKLLADAQNRLQRGFTQGECERFFGNESPIPCPSNIEELFGLQYHQIQQELPD